MYSERLTKLKLEIVCNNAREKRDPCFLSFIKVSLLILLFQKLCIGKLIMLKLEINHERHRIMIDASHSMLCIMFEKVLNTGY
jgi:hypothetical protein